ncbi:MAG: hypothetical protein ACRDPD_18950 [Streptosporangiaceae bacterium]
MSEAEGFVVGHAEAALVGGVKRLHIDDTGGFVIHDVSRAPDPHISRPNSAPAYYQSRPASVWISIMKPAQRAHR